MGLLLKMGEIDEAIIKHGMERFGLTRDEVIKQLQELVDQGLYFKEMIIFSLALKVSNLLRRMSSKGKIMIKI